MLLLLESNNIKTYSSFQLEYAILGTDVLAGRQYRYSAFAEYEGNDLMATIILDPAIESRII